MFFLAERSEHLLHRFLDKQETCGLRKEKMFFSFLWKTEVKIIAVGIMKKKVKKSVQMFKDVKYTA